MTTVLNRHVLDEGGFERLIAPRDDFLVRERRGQAAPELAPEAGRSDQEAATLDAGPAARYEFMLDEGPFAHYQRVVELEHTADGRLEALERTTFRVAAPVWRVLLTFPVKRALRRKEPHQSLPWWAPPDRFDTTTARTVSLLCVAMIVSGYLGTIIGQTATFASDEFGTSDRAQGFLFAAVRLGTLLTLVVTSLADHRGRRKLLLVSLVIGASMTVAGAASTGLWSLGSTQAVARGMATAISLLVGIMAAEATPRNSRAYVASVLSLTAGLGAGMVVWILPIADIGLRAWRVLYLVPLVALPVTWWIARHLRESKRFEEHLERGAPDLGNSMVRSRLVLVASVSFLILMFAAPASQFRNDFLRDERGFSAAQVSLFVLLTNTPVGIGVALGGKWADRRGPVSYTHLTLPTMQ